MILRVIHPLFKLDLQDKGLTLIEENSWFIDKFFAKYTYPFDFEITDELYLKTADYEANVFPLLRGEYDFVMDNFTPPPMAPPEEQQTWSHPRGSDLLVWANACGNSPVIVSDIGDSPLAYDDENFRRLVENSLRWLASDEAKQWAKRR